MLTALFLERSTSHQLKRLPVGSSARDQTLSHTPSPVRACGCSCGGRSPDDSDSPFLPAAPSGGPHCAPGACSIPSAGQPWPWGAVQLAGRRLSGGLFWKGLCAHLRSLCGIRPW